MPRRSSQRRFILLLGAVALQSGCFLEVKDPVQTACQTDAECPVDASNRPTRCVAHGGGEKFCEVGFGPVISAPPPDGGNNAPGNVFYCVNVQQFMTTYCVGCHSEASNLSGYTNFFLDHYEPKGAVKGVFDMLDRVKARAVDQFDTPLQMPPPNYASQPSVAEREALSTWIAAGGPYASGSATYSADVPCVAAPGGSGGGGGTVSFKNQIQPILTAKCSGCHPYMATTARENMVGKKGGCEATLNLVEPGNPGNSFLWRKLVDDAGPRCGQKMPTGGALPQAELTLIQTWIQEGALDN